MRSILLRAKRKSANKGWTGPSERAAKDVRTLSCGHGWAWRSEAITPDPSARSPNGRQSESISDFAPLMLRLIACLALVLVATLSDAAAQRGMRGGGGGGRVQACQQQASEAHPLGTSPECQRILSRLGNCFTYIRGNVGSAKLSEGRGQLRRCMQGRPDPNLTQFGAANSGNMPPGPGRRRQ